MILKQHGGTGMALVMKVHHMGWYLMSEMIETHPESTVTAMKGVLADVQGRGQGHLTNDGGEATAGMRTSGRGPQITAVTVTGSVTDGANYLEPRLCLCNAVQNSIQVPVPDASSQDT